MKRSILFAIVFVCVTVSCTNLIVKIEKSNKPEDGLCSFNKFLKMHEYMMHESDFKFNKQSDTIFICDGYSIISPHDCSTMWNRDNAVSAQFGFEYKIVNDSTWHFDKKWFEVQKQDWIKKADRTRISAAFNG